MEKNHPIKIALLGAESTGKTWLAQNLANHFNTVFVPEYSRHYFSKKNIDDCTIEDIEKIAIEQIQLEGNYLSQANKILFCDTNLITLKIWLQLEFQQASKIIEDLSKENNYGFYLLCNNEIDWTEDALRKNKFSRDLIFELNLNEIKLSSKPFEIVTGIGNERLKKAVRTIEGLMERG